MQVQCALCFQGIAVVRRELGQLARLALPIVFTQLSQMGMGVADTIMAGRVSATDLAGIALGGNLFWPLLLLLTGVLMALTPSVSQLHGARREQETGEVVRQALWVALAGGSLFVLFIRQAEPVLRFIEVDPRAIPTAAAYLQALSWGVLPMLGYFALRYLCEGMSWTLPAMLVALGGLLLKIPLNLLFVYGGLGVPAMGGVGCGYATAIVMCMEFAAMLLVVGLSRMRRSGLFSRFSWPNLREIWRLAKLGTPIGASLFLEIGMFSVTTLMIGRLGVEAVAAHQIAGNLGGLTFMVPLALGMAASIRIGYNVGASDLDAARRSGKVAIGVAAACGVAAALALFFGRSFLTGLYTTDPVVHALAAQLLLFVAFYQLVDDAQATCLGALRGYKDTRTPMFVAFLAYWCVGFPIGLCLGFGAFGLPNLGVYGFWTGMTTGLAVAAVAMLLRFRWLARRPDRILQLAER